MAHADSTYCLRREQVLRNLHQKTKRATGGGGRSQPFGDGGGKGGGTSRGKGGGKGGGSALPHTSRWAEKEDGEVSDTDSEQSLGKRFRRLQQ